MFGFPYWKNLPVPRTLIKKKLTPKHKHNIIRFQNTLDKEKILQDSGQNKYVTLTKIVSEIKGLISQK